MSKKGTSTNRFVLSHKARMWIIAAVVLCVYGKTVQFDFVGLDDRDLIEENYEYIKDLSNIPNAFITHAFYNPSKGAGSNVYYRPVLTLSFMLDAQIGGKSPKFYHFVNILFHIISCLLLMKLLIGFKLNPDLAFFFALMFAVYPVLSQAVGWIPGRNDSLLALFTCASFIFLLKYLEAPTWKHLSLHSVFFGLALFTKESAVGIPVVCLAYVLFFGAKLPPSLEDNRDPGEGWERSSGRGRGLLLSMGYAAFLIPWFFLRQQVMLKTTADLSLTGLCNSFLENLPLYLLFIQKAIIPFPLSILSVPKDTNYAISISLIMLLAFFIFRSKEKNWRMILFGILWFSVFLLPAFVVHILTGFEHRVYLPLIGLFMVLSEIEWIKDFSLARLKHAFAGVALIILFGVMAVSHVGSFSNNYEFWKTAALNSKHSAMARLNYGLAVSHRGDPLKAMAIYKEGLAIDSLEPLIHNNLGILYARRKMFGDAESEFKKEIEVNPKFSDAYYNLGLLYKQAGKDSLMVQMWEKAVRVDPGNSSAVMSLEKYYKSRKPVTP